MLALFVVVVFYLQQSLVEVDSRSGIASRNIATNKGLLFPKIKYIYERQADYYCCLGIYNSLFLMDFVKAGMPTIMLIYQLPPFFQGR